MLIARAALVVVVGSLLALATASAARAAAPAAAPPLVTDATLRQAGADLQFGLRFDRALSTADLRAVRGRLVCVVLSPQRPSQRRACVSGRGGGRLVTLARVDRREMAVGTPRVVRGSRVVARGGYLSLRMPAEALGLTLGRVVRWRAYVRWPGASGCALAAADCAQWSPERAAPARTLTTRAPRRPAFTRLNRLRLLATGDSMIQVIDSQLAQRLAGRRGTTVRSDAQIGSGISKPAQLDWVRKARGQATSFKPDVTVIFLGANDGFPIAAAACCGPLWVAAYAGRVETMMRSYLRGGRSYVYWLTLPEPRPAAFARIYRPVNTAIKRAAERVGGGVRVIDTARVFTPDGAFRQTITFRGRTINARQPDGIHLSTAGADVAATLVIERLRADGALP